MFDLAVLTEFPRDLVLYFETEASLYSPPHDSMPYMLHKGKQYIDIYQAYLYAQNNVLPAIKEHGIAAFGAERLELEMQKMHALMAATLGKDHGFPAGQYIAISNDPADSVARWHLTVGVVPHIAQVLGSPLVGAELDRMIDHYSIQIAENFRVNAADMKNFFNVAKRYKNASGSLGERGQQVVAQLAMATFENTLSEAERSAVGKIVTFIDPRKVPNQIKAFYQETVELWKACDVKNAKALSELLAKTFYRFTDIHPYPNGNGRMGTLLLNIMLRSLDQPAILLREPGDKSNPDSSYASAVDSLIAGNWHPMAAHIQMRMNKACMPKTPESAENAVLMERFISLDMRLAHVLSKIQSEFPEFKLEAYFTQLSSKAHAQYPVENIEDDNALQQRYSMLFTMLDQLSKKHTDLLLERIKQGIAKISGYESWDGAPDGLGVKCWRVMDSASQAESLVDRLSQYAFLTLEKKDLIYPDETIPLFIIKSTIPDIIEAEKAIHLRAEKQRASHTLGPVF